MLRSFKKVLTVAIAGVTFAVSAFYLKLNIFMALLFSGVIYIGLTLLFKPAKKVESKAPQVKDIVRKGKMQVQNIRYEGRRLPNEQVKRQVMKICDIADEIFSNFIKEPKDLRDARKFLNYYLDTTQKIVKLYSDLSKKTAYSEKEISILTKAEHILAQIEEVFEKQKGKLLENDYLELSIELDVLEMTIKSEGV